MERYEYLNGPPSPRMVAELAMRHDALVKQLADAQATIATLQTERDEYKTMYACLTGETYDNPIADLYDQLAQRTAELERVRKKLGETKLYLQQERANRDSLVACVNRDVKTIKELRALILALPKVEGEITANRVCTIMMRGLYCEEFTKLLQHRQGME